MMSRISRIRPRYVSAMQALSVQLSRYRRKESRDRCRFARCSALASDMALVNWAAMRRSSAARPASLQTATSPLVRAFAQLKLGARGRAAGASGVGASGSTGADRFDGHFICRSDLVESLLGRGPGPGKRRQRRDDVVRIGEGHDVSTPVRGRLDRVEHVGAERAASADDSHLWRKVEGQRAVAGDRVRLGIFVAKRRSFHANGRVAGNVAEHGLVAAAKRRCPAEQLTLDLIVGRAACAALLRVFARCRDFVARETIVLAVAPCKNHHGDDEQDQGAEGDGGQDRGVYALHGAANAFVPSRLHYSR